MAACATALVAPELCIVCGIAPRSDLWLPGGAILLRCPRCRLGWWDWTGFDSAAFYDDAYFQSPDVSKGYNDYAALEGGIRRTARARLRRIARLMGPRGPATPKTRQPPRLLDIGCGTGVFLDEARRAGWSVTGLEVSAYAVDVACQRGLDVARGSADDLAFDAGSFDCITLLDVIEHVPDPAGTLRRAVCLLRPGGVLVISTGDVESLCARLSGRHWHLYNLPEHLFFFSLTALRALIVTSGARVCDVTREVNWVPVSYLVERLSKSHHGLARLLDTMPVRTALGALAQRAVPATLLDVLGVYARRRGRSRVG